jgi:hypothetical protein
MFFPNPLDVKLFIYVQGIGKKNSCFKSDTKWVHIVPITQCYFQSCVRKNTHRHKDVIGL